MLLKSIRYKNLNSPLRQFPETQRLEIPLRYKLIYTDDVFLLENRLAEVAHNLEEILSNVSKPICISLDIYFYLIKLKDCDLNKVYSICVIVKTKYDIDKINKFCIHTLEIDLYCEYIKIINFKNHILRLSSENKSIVFENLDIKTLYICILSYNEDDDEEMEFKNAFKNDKKPIYLEELIELLHEFQHFPIKNNL